MSQQAKRLTDMNVPRYRWWQGFAIGCLTIAWLWYVQVQMGTKEVLVVLMGMIIGGILWDFLIKEKTRGS